jgi:hypothetical protein
MGGDMTASEFLARFDYRLGRINDGARDIRRNPVGDCSDFAWSLLLCLEGGYRGAIWAVITGRAMFWLVWSPHNNRIPRHVALRYSNAWIDSTERKWRSSPYPHRRALPMWVYIFVPVLVGVTVGRIWK